MSHAKPIKDISGLLLADIESRATPDSPFIDTTFPPSDASLGHVAKIVYEEVECKEIKWRRLSDMCAHYKVNDLFPPTFNATDIKQGVCPDCFCITAVCALCQWPEQLRHLFITQTLSAKGVYCLQFFHNGCWTPVIVDDWVPCSPKNINKPLLARSRTNHPWPALIEKAYAKLYGSFEALIGGNTAEALFDLTGGPVDDYSLTSAAIKQEIMNGTLFQRLQKEQKAGAMMAAGTMKVSGRAHERKENGLVAGHAYHLMYLVPLERKNITLLRLQNPWGKSTWKGDWCEGSRLWTPALKQEAGAEDQCPGTFFISDKDFLKHFESINVVRKMPQLSTDLLLDLAFDHSSAGGCNNFISWGTNPILLLQNLNTTADVFFIMQQEDQRGRTETIDFDPIGFTLITVPELSPIMMCGGAKYNVIHKTAFKTRREISVRLTLPAQADPYLLVPSSFFPGLQFTFRMYIKSTVPLQVSRHSSTVPHRITLNGKWTASKSGGYKDIPSNPQFTLKVDHDCTIHVTLQQAGGQGPYTEKGNLIGELPIACLCYRGTEYCSQQPAPKQKVGPEVQFTKHTEVGRTIALKAAEGPFCLVPCTFTAGLVGDFSLTVMSEMPFILQSAGAPSLAPRTKASSSPSVSPNRSATSLTPGRRSGSSTPKPKQNSSPSPPRPQLAHKKVGGIASLYAAME